MLTFAAPLLIPFLMAGFIIWVVSLIANNCRSKH